MVVVDIMGVLVPEPVTDINLHFTVVEHSLVDTDISVVDIVQEVIEEYTGAVGIDTFVVGIEEAIEDMVVIGAEAVVINENLINIKSVT